jgi:hypothetical protein
MTYRPGIYIASLSDDLSAYEGNDEDGLHHCSASSVSHRNNT